MKAKIVVITSSYLHSYVQNILDELKPDSNVRVIEYTNFDHVAQIYLDNEENADGFLISGRAALAALERAVPNHKKPALAFQADLASLYRLMLELFLEQRDLDTSRVILDFLLPFSDDATIDHFLHGMDLDKAETDINQWLISVSKKDLSVVEWTIVQKAILLWEKHSIDLVISQYGSIIPYLEEKGIPCRYVAPSKELFRSVLENLLSQIELESMHANFPAVIAFAAQNTVTSQTPPKELQEAVASIQKDFPVYAIMQEEGNRCYLYTTRKAAYHVTDELRSCHFRKKLQDEFGVIAAIGYGIGRNITDAKKHADDALKESFFSNESFVVDEKHRILGPLSSEQYLAVYKRIPTELSDIAHQCNLSPLTIQKLLSIVQLTGSTKFTTSTLSEHLGVTVRNANRIIQNLEKGGAAVFAYTQSSGTKGRPIKVFELKISEDSLS